MPEFIKERSMNRIKYDFHPCGAPTDDGVVLLDNTNMPARGPRASSNLNWKAFYI